MGISIVNLNIQPSRICSFGIETSAISRMVKVLIP
jgi:hypothetical protein